MKVDVAGRISRLCFNISQVWHHRLIQRRFLHIAAVKCNQMCACDRPRHQEDDAKTWWTDPWRNWFDVRSEVRSPNNIQIFFFRRFFRVFKAKTWCFPNPYQADFARKPNPTMSMVPFCREQRCQQLSWPLRPAVREHTLGQGWWMRLI